MSHCENSIIKDEIQFSNTFDLIEKVMYINLLERTDRLESIKNTLSSISSDKIIRFNAIKDLHKGAIKGLIGCAKSHIECLNIAKKNNWKNVMILEDDAIWRENIDFNKLNELLNNSYDVIVLGGCLVQHNKITNKLYECTTCTGYIVSNHYYDTLIDNYTDGLNKMIKTNNPPIYAIDQHWKILQKKDNWFIVQLLIQKPGFSDNEKRHVDITKYFTPLN